MAMRADEPEVPLAGGNMNAGVVRVGATVRRPVAPQTSTVHRVLRHARAMGVDWVPRVHGLDDQGREILDFIEGDVHHDEPDLIREPHLLTEVARALRQWHDATATFPRTRDDVWFSQASKTPEEVICHVDFAPYNHVLRDGHFVGAIDFDTCCPGPRLWDLTYTAYRYVPLMPAHANAVPAGHGWGVSPFSVAAMHERLAMFLDAYGASPHSLTGGMPRPYASAELLALLPERLAVMAAWCAQQTNPGPRRDGEMYRAHAEWAVDGMN